MDRGTSGAARGAPERHGEGEHGGRGCALAGAGGSAALAAAHSAAPDCRSAGLALAGGWPVAGAARRFPAVAHRLWLVPTLAGGWRFRCLDAGDRPPAPSVGGPARGAAPVHHRYAGGQVHQRARAARIRCRQGCVGSQARGPGGRRRALARGRCGPGFGAEPVLAKAGNRDALAALDRGKAMWPSLREAVYDGAFTAERCRTWSNWHGMRHHIVERDPAAKGFVVVARRWVVERSLVGSRIGMVSPAIAPDALMSPLGASPSSPSSPASRP